MFGSSETRFSLSIITAIAGAMTTVLVVGCNSERTAPLPIEAKTPGELRPPAGAPGAQPLPKNVNPNAPRSIKDVQPKQ
jgi:hypothetical protein